MGLSSPTRQVKMGNVEDKQNTIETSNDKLVIKIQQKQKQRDILSKAPSVDSVEDHTEEDSSCEGEEDGEESVGGSDEPKGIFHIIRVPSSTEQKKKPKRLGLS